MKEKYLRANDRPHMSKTLHEATMPFAKTRKKFYKSKSYRDKRLYNCQRNLCTSINRNEKKKYYEHLNISKITEIK